MLIEYKKREESKQERKRGKREGGRKGGRQRDKERLKRIIFMPEFISYGENPSKSHQSYCFTNRSVGQGHNIQPR